jgi:hypothetical protein
VPAEAEQELGNLGSCAISPPSFPVKAGNPVRRGLSVSTAATAIVHRSSTSEVPDLTLHGVEPQKMESRQPFGSRCPSGKIVSGADIQPRAYCLTSRPA